LLSGLWLGLPLGNAAPVGDLSFFLIHFRRDFVDALLEPRNLFYGLFGFFAGIRLGRRLSGGGLFRGRFGRSFDRRGFSNSFGLGSALRGVRFFAHWFPWVSPRWASDPA
jgi:hypothetical protein